MPIDIILGVDELRAEELAPENYIDRLQKKLEKVYRFARENINEFQTRQKRDYDVKLFEHQYSLGDLVYEIDSSTKLGQSRKLKKMWKGPYSVVKVISPALYQIKGTKEPRIVHHDRLKLCLDRDVPVWVKRQRKLLFEDRATGQGNNALETKPNHKTIQKQRTNPRRKDSDVCYDGIKELFENAEATVTTSKGRKIKKPSHLLDFEL